MNRRAKQHGGSVAGDWSDTGTFLRKPTGGWIHEDAELQNGLSINYNVQYLGSIVVNTSMRTLQFNVRTQVTKEAITRLAEASGNIFIGKKKKAPKQVDRVLGVMDVRWAGEANLSVSVDSLKINNDGGMVILNHSLPSISFASGGDGATADYIGYVAKDPVHGRACHVFECPRSSHNVLATIGQAFELRYKMYLNSSRSSVQPIEEEPNMDGDAWGNRNVGRAIQTTVDIHPGGFLPSPPPDNDDGVGIYSDIPDLPPPDESPPPIPSARYTLAERPGPSNGHVQSQLGNPYDTMELGVRGTAGKDQPRSDYESVGEGNIYEEGELITSRHRNIEEHPERPDVSEYTSNFISIRQSIVTDTQDEIDLTPPLTRKKLPDTHDYSNIDAPSPPAQKTELKKIPPKPAPFKPSASVHTTAAAAAATGATPTTTKTNIRSDSDEDYDVHNVEKVLGRHKPPLSSSKPSRAGPLPKPPPPAHSSPKALHQNIAGTHHHHDSPKPPQIPLPKVPSPKVLHSGGGGPPPSSRNSYDEPSGPFKPKPAVAKKPVLMKTRPGMYDDVDEVMVPMKLKAKPKKPSREGIVDGTLAKENRVVHQEEEDSVYNTPEGVYDDGDQVVRTPVSHAAVPMSPKFDDGIYMDSNVSNGVRGGGGGATQPPPPPAAKPQKTKAAPIDPLAPLPCQLYFHGPLSRVEAEALMVSDGEYLIRESTKKPGQYVLTGMALGRPQHLLLMDKDGKVKSKDREFDSVPHLIKHFTESRFPLVIGGSQVFLKKPVVNAFLTST